MKCWGSNGRGEMGNGTTTSNYTVWHDVLNLTNVTRVQAGGYLGGHNCALVGGAVWCWGDNDEGQLVIDKTTTYSATPVQVPGITNARQLALGGNYTCVVRTDNSVSCWGLLPPSLNFGTGSPVPQAIAGWTNVSSMAAGYAFACAVQAGQVYCFGTNGTGQLGGSTTTTPVPGLANVTAISLGNQHACVVQSSGDVRCWGLGTSGQLGNGQSVNSSTPVRAGP